MDSIKDVVRSSEKVLDFDKHLKKAGGHIGRNVVEITIKIKTIVRKPLRIKTYPGIWHEIASNSEALVLNIWGEWSHIFIAITAMNICFVLGENWFSLDKKDISYCLMIFIIKGLRTIVFISITIPTTFRPICPPAFFRCLSNSRTFTELRTTPFTESTGVGCSDSVCHNQVQVLSIPDCR